MLVLDSSGSMAEPAGGGETKIQAAKQALRDVVGALPDDAAVGMRVFGAEVFSRDQPGACTDSQQVVAAGTDNRDALLREIERYRPYGETPIGYALRQAAEDLDPDTVRSIVLVSDGVATCEPDPCEVAQELTEQGVDLRIDVVGLAVDGEARAQLRCIAGVAEGRYYDASSAEEIVTSLSTATERALRPFEIDGEPVVGGPSQAEALPLGAGRYADRLAGREQERWYVYERQVPGSTVIASSYELQPGGLSDLQVDVVEPDGGGCGTSTFSTIVPLFTGKSDLAPAEGGFSCGDPVHVRVTRLGDETGPLPFGLSIVEEPPVENFDSLPSEVDSSVLTEPARARGRAEPVIAGTSFEDAPALEPGTTYAATIVPGEVNAFRVPVGWGQSLAVRVDRPGLTPAQDEAISSYSSFFDLQLMSPLRASLGDDLDAAESTSRVDTGPTVQMTGISSVAWTNRERDDAHFLAGDYYVLYGADVDSATSVELPYTITVEVQGEESGEPAYASPGELITTGEPLTATEATPSDEADAGTTPDPAEEAEAAEGDDGASGAPGWLVPAAVGAGALVLLAALALVVRRRRTP
ncbi:VWA domain-containing protein [Nocardioides sp.]|uniref:vWA domain-containing protein n=1 Tax=Nocardioides sp. TaxID=35761 RepID=UPI00261766DF|nr:VWA domain-containing protein [Nocardioides sp.]